MEIVTCRLPIIPPANLNSEQKPLYDDMREGIAKNFQGFINVRDDGALLGPWNPWMHETGIWQTGLGADESNGVEAIATGGGNAKSRFW